MTAIQKGLEPEVFSVLDCPFKDNEMSALHAIDDFDRLREILQASCSYSIMFGIFVTLF